MEAIEQSDEHLHIFTRHLEVPSNPEIAVAQRGLIAERIDTFGEAGVPDVTTGTSPTLELNVRGHLTAVSDQVVGIRMNTFELSGLTSGTSYETQWFDLKNHVAAGSRELFGDDEDWAQFQELVIQAASNQPHISTDGPLALKNSWLDSLNFDAHGNLLVEFDDDCLSPDDAGPIEAMVPAHQMVELLSPFGQLARAAVLSHSPVAAATKSLAAPSTATEASALPTTHGVPEQTPTRRAVDCSIKKCIALTFDDGPGPKTGTLLDSLMKGNAPSTFFVTGPNAKLRPALLQRMVAEGHQIGNHTWSHRSFASLSSNQIRREIDRTNDVITAATGSPASLLRPPYGAHHSISDRLANTPVILWDVDTLDWKHRNTAKVIESAVSQSSPGSIVLMHDIHSSTVAGIPKVISSLRPKGYTFVTVSELMGDTGLEAGQTYSHGPHPGTNATQESGNARR